MAKTLFNKYFYVDLAFAFAIAIGGGTAEIFRNIFPQLQYAAA